MVERMHATYCRIIKRFGEYIEIKMLPFSFAESYKSRGGEDADRLFADHMANSSFSYIEAMDRTKEKADIDLEDIYDIIIVKEIEER